MALKLMRLRYAPKELNVFPAQPKARFLRRRAGSEIINIK